MTKRPGDQITVALKIPLSFLHGTDARSDISPKTWFFCYYKNHFSSCQNKTKGAASM
jgi:hypothetical protein